MSVWSRLRLSKKAAKDHKAAVAKESDSSNPKKETYKHTPSHAAVDALSGAPSSWKVEDRPRIMEQHKRRSQMTISRTQSTMSNVAYGGAATGGPSKPNLYPRHSSYNSYNPTWNERGDNGQTNETIRRDNSKLSVLTRGESSYSLGPSPLMSHVVSAEVSPVTSSSNSTASVELKPNSSQFVFGEQDVFNKLHKSTNRKLGEAPILSAPKRGPSPTKDLRVATEQAPAKKGRWAMMGKSRVAAVGA